MTVERALDCRAIIGESPTWVPDEDALYWIDVKAPALHRHSFRNGATRSWKMTSEIGAFALTHDGGAVVALRQGLHRLDFSSGGLRLLAPPPFDPALFRFNEGACDAQGRFWIGVMFDPVNGSEPARPGKLHSFTFDGGLREEPDAAELHNGMAWSEDGKTFYLSHSRSGEIIAFEYDCDQGAISNRRTFATVPVEAGIPDGAATDVEGCYWSALHGGARLRRFRPDGSVDRDIEIPVSRRCLPSPAGNSRPSMSPAFQMA